MNVMHKLTLASLRKNRRRTVVTILGTAVAVAMVTAIAVLAASFMQMSRTQTILESGNWHLKFLAIDKRALSVLEAYENYSDMDISLAEGFARLPGREHYTRKALAVTAYGADSYNKLPITLLEGRMPEAPGELLLSEEFRDSASLDWPTGGQVTLDYGHYADSYVDENGTLHPVEIRSVDGVYTDDMWVSEGNRTFTVVGYAQLNYLEQGWHDSFAALTVFDPAATEEGQRDMTAWMRVKRPTETLYADGAVLCGQLKELYGHYFNMPDTNSGLLAVSGVFSVGGLLDTLAAFLGILLFIIAAGSISLINNAFSISLAERVRALGMMAGVGATKKQKRQSVFFEAFVVGIFAIPAGILGGIAGIAVTLAVLGTTIGQVFIIDAPMTLAVPVWAIAFTVGFSACILLLSAWLPARKAARISPVEAMRSGGNAGVRRVKVSRFTRKLLGFEAEIGVKNSKRNRRRYFAILSSLVVSVVLFLSVSAAIRFVQQAAGLATEDVSHNVRTHLNLADTELTFDDFEQKVTEIRALPNAGTVDAFFVASQKVLLPESVLTEKAKRELENMTPYENGSYFLNITLFALDEDTMARYCDEAGVQPATLEGGNKAVLVSPMELRTQTGGWARFDVTTLRAGDTLSTVYYANEENIEEGTTWQVGAVSSLYPPGMPSRAEYMDKLVLVVPLAYYENIMALEQEATGANHRFMDVYINSPDSGALYDALEKMPEDERFYINNFDMGSQLQNNQMRVLVLSVFSYGFVALITLVCVANIFNTVSTGIALRAREFAMLRSVGLTRKGFNRMLDCETLLYGVKALAFGIPASLLISLALYRVMNNRFDFPFSLPWAAYLVVAIGVFVVVGTSALYARAKVRKLNIAETLKNENW